MAGEEKAQAGQQGAEGAYEGEHVGRDPAGLPVGEPDEGFAFHSVDDGGLYALCLFGMIHDGC